MARFDELFDGIIHGAKKIATTASEKTSDVLEITRLRYRQNQVSAALEKTYAKLGAIVYEAEQNGEDFENLIDKAVEEIAALNLRYDQLEEAIALVGKPAAVPPEVVLSPRPEEPEQLEDIDCAVCTGDDLEEMDFTFAEELTTPPDEEIRITIAADELEEELEPQREEEQIADIALDTPVVEFRETDTQTLKTEADRIVEQTQQEAKQAMENKTVSVEIIEDEDEE